MMKHKSMERFVKFIILIVSIFVGVGIGIALIFLLAPLLAGGIFLWVTMAAVSAFIILIIRFVLGVWLIAGEDEKKLTKADKSFSIKQGKEVTGK